MCLQEPFNEVSMFVLILTPWAYMGHHGFSGVLLGLAGDLMSFAILVQSRESSFMDSRGLL